MKLWAFRLMAVAMLLFISWIIVLANTQQSSIFFDFVAWLPYGDKLGHIGLFGSLTFLVCLATRMRYTKVAGIHCYWGSLFVFSAAVLEELSQGFVSSRTLDVADLIADIFGIIVGSFLAKQFAAKLGLKTHSKS